MRKTIAALAAAVVGALLVPAGPAEADAPTAIRESFATVEDGRAPAVTLDGSRSVTNYSGPNLGATPYIRDGRLTTTDPDTALGGSYRIVDLGADVTRVGATFSFTPHAAQGGVLCLSIQDESIATSEPVPASPIHLVVSPTGWSVDVNTESGTGVDVLAGGAFDQPLASDGETLLEMEVVVDREAGKLWVALPDGTTRTFANPAFSLAGDHVYVEPFKAPSGGPLANQANALVSEWWASTAPEQVASEATAVPIPTPTPTPAPVVAEAPTVTVVTPPPAPVVKQPATPLAPRKVTATRNHKRVVVKWKPAPSVDAYRVKCGAVSKVVDGRRVALTSSAKRCKVRAVNETAASRWVAVRVR